MVNSPNLIFRDYEVDGVASSGSHKVIKAEARALFTYFDSIITAGTLSDAVWKDTKANLDADLAHAAETIAVVYSDSTAANNGIYKKSGASGVGSWSQLTTFLPGYQFVNATDDGGSAANAWTMDTSPQLPSGDGVALVSLVVPVTNTDAAVTVSFDGGTALTVKTAAGNAPAVGGLVAGMAVMGIVQGSTFLMRSDQTSSAIQAAAEAALADLLTHYLGPYSSDAAATAAAGGSPTTGQLYWNTSTPELRVYSGSAWTSVAQSNNWAVERFAGDGTDTTFTLAGAPGSVNNVFISIDGILQHRDTFSLSGTGLTFTAAPPGDGVTENIEVSYGSSTDIGTPSDGTVTKAKMAANSVGDTELDFSEAPAIRAGLDLEPGVDFVTYQSGAVLKRVAATPYTANSDLGTIPADDTLPQVTEGTEVLTLAVQALNSDDVIDLVFNGSGGMSVSGALIAAMFIDGAANAVRASWVNVPSSGLIRTIPTLVYSYAPADTISHTVSIRCGTNTGTGRLNGTSTSRYLGGAIAATLTATIRRP